MTDTPDWILVPRDPTEAMIKAGGAFYAAESVWDAMLAAASLEHPLRDRGEPKVYAWEGYWAGAGSINSETRITRHKLTMERWAADGAEITPLYASLPPARVEEVASLRDALQIARNYLLNEIGDAKDRYAADDLDIIDRALGSTLE